MTGPPYASRAAGLGVGGVVPGVVGSKAAVAHAAGSTESLKVGLFGPPPQAALDRSNLMEAARAANDLLGAVVSAGQWRAVVPGSTHRRCTSTSMTSHDVIEASGRTSKRGQEKEEKKKRRNEEKEKKRERIWQFRTLFVSREETRCCAVLLSSWYRHLLYHDLYANRTGKEQTKFRIGAD